MVLDGGIDAERRVRSRTAEMAPTCAAMEHNEPKPSKGSATEESPCVGSDASMTSIKPLEEALPTEAPLCCHSQDPDPIPHTGGPPDGAIPDQLPSGQRTAATIPNTGAASTGIPDQQPSGQPTAQRREPRRELPPVQESDLDWTDFQKVNTQGVSYMFLKKDTEVRAWHRTTGWYQEFVGAGCSARITDESSQRTSG